MKKLTAGIFATILGLTAVDAFAASNVASTKYVQGAIDSLAEVAKTGDYGDLINAPVIPSIEGLATTDYVDQAKLDAISAAAEAAKIYIDADELKGSQEAQDVVLKKYADDAVATGTADMATQTWVGSQGYVTTTEMGNQGFATKTYVDQAEADAISAAATDATTKADAAQAAAIAAAATDATTKADAAQAAAISAAATDATTKADAAEAAAIAAAASAAAQLYVPLTAVVDSYPDASLNQQGQ